MSKNKIWTIVIHKDSFLLLSTLVFLWFTIVLFISENTKFEELSVHAGRITRAETLITKIVDKPLFKDTTREMRMYINDDPCYYYVTSKTNFSYLDSLFIEDSVKIYTSEKTFRLFAFGKRVIMHLERLSDKKVFINFETGQKSKRNLYLLTGFATLGFLIWYILKVRKRIFSEG